MKIPKPILSYFLPNRGIEITAESAVEFWLCNEDGSSFFLKWWGNGWVIYCQSSYLCKDKEFKHESEIVAWEHSKYGPSDSWQHVFATKEDAIETFLVRKNWSR